MTCWGYDSTSAVAAVKGTPPAPPTAAHNLARQLGDKLRAVADELPVITKHRPKAAPICAAE